MTTHPYRAASSPEHEPKIAAGDDGLRLAFAVMTFTGAIEVGIAIVHPGTPPTAIVFGASCFVAGLAWLLRHRDQPPAAGSRRR
ncbi:MAG TPA: hypothetical protein VMJ10_32370 [Kofleriaceae bacterium]|nr:hypothetical protein [Kofleriaceae bacterium]